MKNRVVVIAASVLITVLALAAVHAKVLYFVMYRPYSAYLYLSSFFYKQAFLQTGEFPLWDPLMMCGVSDTANMPFPLSLFRIFALLGFSSIFSVFLTELFFIMMGMIFFYLLTRLNKCSRPVSFLGSFLYMFWLYKWNVSEGYPMALAPVIFYVSQRYEENPRYKYIFWGALAVAVTCLTGIIHATAVIFVFHMVLMGCFLARGMSKRYCLAGFVSWVLGFTLALPSLLPQAKDVLTSQRIFYAKGLFDFSNFDWAKFWLRLNEVLQIFPFSPLFLFCFVLAFMSVFFLNDKKLKTMFAVSMGFLIFHIILSFTQSAWKALPVIGKLINAFDLYRSAALTGFVILFFAMQTMQQLVYCPPAGRNRKICVGAAAVLLTGFFVFLYQVATGMIGIVIAGCIGVVLFILGQTFVPSKTLKRALNILLLGVVVYYSVLSEASFFYDYCYRSIRKKGFPFIETVVHDFYPRTYLGLFADEPQPSKGLILKMLQDSSDQGHFRSADIGNLYNFYNKVRFYSDGVSSIYGVANIYPARYYEFFAWMSNQSAGETTDAAYAFGINADLDKELLSLSGVQWLIAPSNFSTDKYRLSWKGGKYAVYRNEEVFPRAFAAFGVKVMSDKAQMETYLKSANADLLRNFPPVLESDLKGQAGLSALAGGTSAAAEIITYEPNQVVIEVKMDQDGVLVLTDMFHPNWRATVDGVAAEIYPAYYAFRMVAVPKGEHTVRFFIKDDAFVMALWISCVTFFGMVLFFFWKKLKREAPGEFKKRKEHVF